MTTHSDSFAGRVAFVTGGGTGIGRAAALAFARQGASVAVVGHDPEPLEEKAKLIEQAGGHALALACDVSRSEDVKAAVERTLETFGRLTSRLTTPASSSPSSRSPR